MLRDDVQTLFGILIANNLALSAGAWIMPPTVVLGISLMLNPLSQPRYPTITMMGGALFWPFGHHIKHDGARLQCYREQHQ